MQPVPGTSRYYGETDELLGNYAWYTKNTSDRLRRVGLKKPNDFGLFDMQGNCFTWCQEAYNAYPKVEGEEGVEDTEDVLMIKGTASRVLRGGSFLYTTSLVRSALRLFNQPTYRRNSNGFRLARTLPLASLTPLPPTP